MAEGRRFLIRPRTETTPMKKHRFLLPALLGLTLGSLPAQSWTPVPEPEKSPGDLRVLIDPASPLNSLEHQLVNASYDQRGEFAVAFDTASLAVRRRVDEMRAQGLDLDDAASGNLEEARTFGAQMFRDLSLSTEETWRTSRHNALMALRKIRSSFDAVRQTASLRRS